MSALWWAFLLGILEDRKRLDKHTREKDRRVSHATWRKDAIKKKKKKKKARRRKYIRDVEIGRSNRDMDGYGQWKEEKKGLSLLLGASYSWRSPPWVYLSFLPLFHPLPPLIPFICVSFFLSDDSFFLPLSPKAERERDKLLETPSHAFLRCLLKASTCGFSNVNNSLPLIEMWLYLERTLKELSFRRLHQTARLANAHT